MDNIPLREDQRKHLSRNEDILLSASNNISSLDKYLQEMSQPGHWADGIMLACASKLFERQINVLMEDGSVIVFRPNEEDLVETTNLLMPTVFIGFITTSGSTSPNHYVLLERKKNDDDATSQPSLPPKSACVSCCYFTSYA